MFGFFKRRANERAAERAAMLAEVTTAVYEKLAREIADVVDAALSEPNFAEEDVLALTARAAAVERGVELVLLDGVDAYGPAAKDLDAAVRGGAMLAHGARNMTLISGTLDHPDSWGDIRHLLGLSRQ